LHLVKVFGVWREIFVENLLVLSKNVELFGIDSESFEGGGEFLRGLGGRLAAAGTQTLYVITAGYPIVYPYHPH
jgi:hypothetical protein